MSSFEIEIKSLLGDKARADNLIKDIHALDPNTKLIDENNQLNHYFVDGDINELYDHTKGLFKDIKRKKQLKKIIEDGSNFSVRTREANGEIRLVLKASIGDDSSFNGVSRMEFDECIKEKTLEELDQLLLDAGFQYQAKWSRERREYLSNGMNVCIDKNAGYGYLAEFEKVVESSDHSKQTEKEIREFMKRVECEELEQDRLERMFAHYNKNWPEYYGTNNVFVIL